MKEKVRQQTEVIEQEKLRTECQVQGLWEGDGAGDGKKRQV